MAIFSRRILQRLLDENSNFITESQLREHINRLNKVEPQAIDTEWEVVILNAFSKLGNVSHEPDFMSTDKKVDLLFQPFTGFESAFIADIATVSTSGLDEDNPIWFLSKELAKKIRQSTLNPSDFSFDVGGKKQGQRGKQKMVLKLPPKKEFDKLIFNQDFHIFLKQCRNQTKIPNYFSINNYSIEITIKFTPGQEFVSFGYPNYQSLYSLTKNPIYNALNRKHEQLKKIHENIPKGIILCSSNYNFYRMTKKSSISDYSIDNIILHFLEQNQSIAFVLTVSAEAYRDNSYSPRKYRIYNCVYVNHKIEIREEIIRVLHEVVSYLPKPNNDGINSVHRLNWLKDKPSKYRHQGESFYGGYTICGNTIKISLRGLQELLANRISSEYFLKTYCNCNYFLTHFVNGNKIKNIIAYYCPEEDDDWVDIMYAETTNNISVLPNNNMIEMCDDSIRISLIALQILLANLEPNLMNIIQPNNFTEHLFNYCENKLIEGRLIKEFIMLNNFKENEDWVEIKFGIKDVAISKFYDACKT